MKAMHLGVFLASSVVVLAGCASTPETASSAPNEPTLVAKQPTVHDDYQYMARVEEAARIRGIALQWVNPPQKRELPEQ
ncbi:MAG TPA: hypothetical protein VLM17_11670 [Xanthomonadaceae bacterium]|nr:hypothetical protein [Xanthomonadaceae bacterium]